MGERGLVVANAVHDRQPTILLEPLEAGHPRLEAEGVIDLAQLVSSGRDIAAVFEAADDWQQPCFPQGRRPRVAIGQEASVALSYAEA